VNIDDVVVELDDVVEARADRGERRLEIFERLGCLGAKISGAPVAAEAELAGDIDNPARHRDLDHVGIAYRFRNGFRIKEANVVGHGVVLLSYAPCGA